MKYLPILLVLLFVGCKKEEPCTGCTLKIFNIDPEYSYVIEFSNWPGAPVGDKIPVGGSKTYNIPSGRRITVKGNYQSPFAHNDYNALAECDGDCGAIIITMKQ